jgi:hypothetical protein
MLAAARRAGGDAHHFRVLQLPMNLRELGALTERNNGADGSQSVLAHAAAHGVGVLVNRPLNAMTEGGLQRLADVETSASGDDVDALGRRVSELEREFRDGIATRLTAADGSLPPSEYFTFGRELRALEPRLGSLEQWSQIEHSAVMPRLVSALRSLDEGIQGALEQTWSEWRDRYLPAMRGLLGALRSVAAGRSTQALAPLREALAPRLPEPRRTETLSRQAIWLLTSTPGVSCVLVGMRQQRYVEDATAVLDWEDCPTAADVLVELQTE